MSPRSRPRRIWTMPVLLGVVSALGLVAALLFDAWGNWLSWLSLSAVTVVSFRICIRAMTPKRSSRVRAGDDWRRHRSTSSLG